MPRCGRIMMYLVDTSAWIKHFAASDPFDLRVLCHPDDRVLCLPVYQEILQGIREERVFRQVRSILHAAVFVESPLEMEVFSEAAELYRAARRQGLTIRSSIDCINAVCALRHDLTVLHHDRDFPAISRVSALKEKNVLGTSH